MTKKTLLVISLLLAMIFVFVGCTGESFKFDALTVETMSGDLESNGGVSVSYKGYTYFINGNVGTNTNDNTFGEVTYGAICRVKTSALTDGTFVDRVLESDEYPEVEVLAPKAIYTAATTNANSNGIFIYGDKLYYTTPSTTTDREGAIQNSYLDIMSVSLDGTGTQRLFTVDGNSFDMMIAQNGNNVYAVYLNAEVLYQVNLTDATNGAVEVAEHVSGISFLPSAGVAVFTQAKPEEGHEDHDHEATSNDICIFTVGQEESATVISGKGSDVSYNAILTVEEVTESNIYFSVADDSAGRNGLFRVALSARDNTFGASFSTLKLSGENLLSSGLVYAVSGSENIVFYNATEKYVQYFDTQLKSLTNLFYSSSAPSLLKVSGDKVFYTLSSKIKYFDVQACLNADGDYAREDANVVVSSLSSSTKST